MKTKLVTKLSKAFDKKLSDAVDTFTCTKTIGSGKYNPVTEQFEGMETTSYTGRGVLFGDYLHDLVKPDDYLSSDAKAIVLQSEVTGTPEIKDEWQTAKGKFKIINISPDAVGATYTIQLRSV